MLNIYRTDDRQVHVLNDFEAGCWIHLVGPTNQELSWVLENTGVDPDFLRAPLDEEERSRIDTENAQTLILVDTPFVETDDGEEYYVTIPMGIILLEDCIITVCLKDAPLLKEFF